MTPDAVKAHYRRTLDDVGEDIVIRLYTGTGQSRTVLSNTTVRARVAAFEPQELIGGIVQGDRKLIVLAADLIAAGITIVVGANCKVVVREKELAIKAIDDNTRRIAGELVAYEIQAGG